jgi:NitT/TauT family transport system substrate-binding protein
MLESLKNIADTTLQTAQHATNNVIGVATPVAMLKAARALTAIKSGPLPDELPVCRAAMTGEGLSGPPRALKLAWNATSVCSAAAPVAKERGVFAKHNLDVEFINFGGSTEQLLEAIATGKADAGIGMALRWLMPLEQGFDVRIAAGVHGGCIRLLGSKAADITSLESLRGKTIAISDQLATWTEQGFHPTEHSILFPNDSDSWHSATQEIKRSLGQVERTP